MSVSRVEVVGTEVVVYHDNPVAATEETSFSYSRALNMRMASLNAMNVYVSRLTFSDVTALAHASMWVSGYDEAFVHAVDLARKLPEQDGRRLMAGYTISRVMVEYLLFRLYDDLYESIGDNGVSSARDVLLGTCVAMQAAHLAGSYDYTTGDHATLMKPWGMMMPVLPDGKPL